MSQTPAAGGDAGVDGQLTTRGGLRIGRKVRVSGSATAEALANELASTRGSRGHRQALERLNGAMAVFTAALFGRESTLDDTALGAALSEGPGILRQLKKENLWAVRKFKSMTQAAGQLGTRAWSR